jgi:hypothetical protein
MTHTKISMTEAAAGLLGEYGTSATVAIDENVGVV